MEIRPVHYAHSTENSILQNMHREYHIYQEFYEEAEFTYEAK